MYCYPLSRLSPNFVQHAKQNLTFRTAVVDKEDKGEKRGCSPVTVLVAYGQKDTLLLLPRFYPSPVFPTGSPYFRYLCCSRDRDGNGDGNSSCFSAAANDTTVSTAPYAGFEPPSLHLTTHPPQKQVVELVCASFQKQKAAAAATMSVVSTTAAAAPVGGVLVLQKGQGHKVVGLSIMEQLMLSTGNRHPPCRLLIVVSSEDSKRQWGVTLSCYFSSLQASALMMTTDEVFSALLCTPNQQQQTIPFTFFLFDAVEHLDLRIFASFFNVCTGVHFVLGLAAAPAASSSSGGGGGGTSRRHSPIPSLVSWSLGPTLYDATLDPSFSVFWKDPGDTTVDAQQATTHVAATGQQQQHIVNSMFHVNKSIVDDNEIKKIRQDLYLEPTSGSQSMGGEGNGSSTNAAAAFKAYVETDQFISVPRFYGIEKFGIGTVEACDGADMSSDVTFNGTLKSELPPQQKAHDTAIARMKAHRVSGTILNLYCGAGKTVIGIATAITHHKRTLILVHTVDLLEQWIERLSRFAPNARVGRMQQSRCDVLGNDFVVGMIQSIATRSDYSQEVMKTFGLCIVDECHRIACRFFSSSMTKIPCAHVIGLSATAYRKDGMDNLLFWSCGKIAFSIIRPYVEVIVRMIEHDSTIRVRKLRGGLRLNRSRMLNDLATEHSRNEKIFTQILQLFSEGRTIILLTERIAMIDILAQRLRETSSIHAEETGICTGKVSQATRDQALTKRIILATYQKAREGLDVPILDTLILASPVSDVIQATGRILREMPSKGTPLIVDIWDKIEPFVGSGYSRRRYYRKKRFSVMEAKDRDTPTPTPTTTTATAAAAATLPSV